MENNQDGLPGGMRPIGEWRCDIYREESWFDLVRNNIDSNRERVGTCIGRTKKLSYVEMR